MKPLIWVLAMASMSSPALAQLPVTVAPDQQALLRSDDPQLAANKKLVFDFWREVLQTRDMTKAPDYMAKDYIQHNPQVATGRQGFIDFFSKLEKRPLRPEINNLVTIIAEHDLVVLALRRELPDPDHSGQTYTTTWFDMFRIKDGKIAEHWDYGTKPTR